MDIDDILAEVDDDAIPPETRDVHDLTRAWVTERCAPELLPWPGALMERVMARVRRQISRVEDHPHTTTDPTSNLRLIILQTELERFKYLVRSFLRARIAKIDLCPLYHLSAQPSHPHAVLSLAERHYAAAHTALLHDHYRASFLARFPASLRRLDDAAGGVDMVEGADGDRAVFVRGREGVGRGEVVVVRWSAVREVVGRGGAELI